MTAFKRQAISSRDYVPAEGDPSSLIVLIGEAPARNEILEGRPFVGSAGKFLDKLLTAADLCREDLYITNLSKERVLQDRMSLVSPDDLQSMQEQLIDEINSLPCPKILIPLGNYPLKAVSNKTGITRWRGSILDPIKEIKHDCIVLPTIHPSALHYGANYKQWALIVADLTRAVTLRDSNFVYEKHENSFIIQPTFDQVLDTIEMLNKKRPFVVLDVETAGIALVALGLGWSHKHALSIPFIWGSGKSYWTEDQEFVIWRRLGEVLPKLDIGVQNVFFDWEVMMNHHIRLKTAKWDSMLMHACLWSEMPHGLATIVSIYTNVPFYKKDDEDDRKRSTIRSGHEKNFWIYNCLDCISTLWAIDELKKELIEENMMKPYLTLFADLIEPLFQMNMRGVLIDPENLLKTREHLKDNIKSCNTEISDAAGKPVNVNSWKQVRELLHDVLGMTPYKDRSTGKISSDKNALSNLAHKYRNHVPTAILEARSDMKMLSLFSSDNLDDDGRMRCTYSLAKTKTGRLASKKKGGSRKGLNLQNVKIGVARSLFIPDAGMEMIQVDGKQAEARVVAWLSKDKAMINLFEGGKSIHIENARNLFGRLVNKDEPEYKIAKGLIHGANYGIGSLEFARISGIPHKEAKEHLSAYHNRYPGIRGTFHKNVEQALQTTRTLYNPFGRREIFLDRIEQLGPKAYAFIPQSTVADITKIALKHLFSLGYEILLELHDGLILQSHPENRDQALKDIRDAFNVEFEINGEFHTIPIEISVGPNWRDLEEIGS